MKHDKNFVPSPKAEKKAKATKKKNKHGRVKSEVSIEPAIKEEDEDEDMAVENVESGKGKRKKGTRFGSEATNRPTNAGDEEDEYQTPPKRQKLAVEDEDVDWVPVKRAAA